MAKVNYTTLILAFKHEMALSFSYASGFVVLLNCKDGKDFKFVCFSFFIP